MSKKKRNSLILGSTIATASILALAKSGKTKGAIKHLEKLSPNIKKQVSKTVTKAVVKKIKNKLF